MNNPEITDSEKLLALARLLCIKFEQKVMRANCFNLGECGPSFHEAFEDGWVAVSRDDRSPCEINVKLVRARFVHDDEDES